MVFVEENSDSEDCCRMCLLIISSLFTFTIFTVWYRNKVLWSLSEWLWESYCKGKLHIFLTKNWEARVVSAWDGWSFSHSLTGCRIRAWDAAITQDILKIKPWYKQFLFWQYGDQHFYRCSCCHSPCMMVCEVVHREFFNIQKAQSLFYQMIFVLCSPGLIFQQIRL